MSNEYKDWLRENELEIASLRYAGCNCKLPLLGYRPNAGLRCRSCNTVAKAEPICRFCKYNNGNHNKVKCTVKECKFEEWK